MRMTRSRARRVLRGVSLGVALLLVASAARAQTDPWGSGPSRSKPGYTSLRAGVGFTAEPETFLMELGLPVTLNEGFAVAPNFLLGLEGRDTVAVPGVEAELRLGGLTRNADNPTLRKLVPMLRVEAGLAYIDRDRHGHNKDGFGPSIQAGFGAELEVASGVHLGSHMRFHYLPIETAGEYFLFSWDLMSVRFDFR